jgi:hypothetical protein
MSISILPIHQIHPLGAAESLTATKHPIPLGLDYRNVGISPWDSDFPGGRR